MIAGARFLRASKVAQLLAVSPSERFAADIADGTIHSVRVGGARLVDMDKLEKLLRSNTASWPAAGEHSD